MSETTDGTKLAAKGAPITLVDGRVYHLRYTFNGLLELERRFGSTKGIDEATDRLTDSEGAQGKAYTDLAHFICAGLTDHGLGEDAEVRALLNPRELGAYVIAVLLALSEAYPDAVVENGESDRGKAEATTSSGDRGTTRRRSRSAVPTPSSGR